jgi:hypothetical protein|eukprot:COSAG01_NODE_7252_length_3281_cov_239.018542_3_plen_65_part_00
MGCRDRFACRGNNHFSPDIYALNPRGSMRSIFDQVLTDCCTVVRVCVCVVGSRAFRIRIGMRAK